MMDLEYLRFEEHGRYSHSVMVVSKRNGKLGYEKGSWGWDLELDREYVDRWKSYKGNDKDFLKRLSAIRLETLPEMSGDPVCDGNTWHLEYRADGRPTQKAMGFNEPPMEIKMLKELLGMMLDLEIQLY